ncbi:MAG: hypothetical protein P1P90_04605 [Patescibacteria group bacterium]|nr:hypothetical protein [Patescibacteria group bacterium]
MKLECHTGNIRVPCTVNQSLAFLLQNGLPKIDNRESRTGRLVFVSHVPLSFHGFAHQLRWLRDELASLRKNPPVNGAIVVKWMELMQVPDNCSEVCKQLSPDILNIVWMRSLRQRMPLATVIRIFAA